MEVLLIKLKSWKKKRIGWWLLEELI